MAFFEMILNFGATTRYAGADGRSFFADVAAYSFCDGGDVRCGLGLRTLHQLRTSAYVPIEVAVGVVCYAGFGALFRLEAMRIAWELVKKLFR